MLSAAVRISQPSLSHAIVQLEQELGVPLFEKNGRNVELTQFGEVFLKQVRQSLEILDGSVDYLHRIAAGNGVVRLGLLRALGVECVPALAAGFQRQNADKNVDFAFFTGVTSDIMHKLQRHELDIVLSSKPAETYKFESIPVKKQDLVLIVPPDHRLAIFARRTLPGSRNGHFPATRGGCGHKMKNGAGKRLLRFRYKIKRGCNGIPLHPLDLVAETGFEPATSGL